MQNRLKYTHEVTNKERFIVPVLGINVDSTELVEVLKQICEWIEAKSVKRPRLVVTPNPEILLQATHDRELAKILNNADLSLPDGVGTVAAMHFISLPTTKNSFVKPTTLLFQGVKTGLDLLLQKNSSLSRVPGRVVFDELVKLSTERGWRVFLMGGKAGVAQEAAKRLKVRFPILEVQFDAGPWLGEDGKPARDKDADTEKQIIDKINRFKPDLLFVGFGATKQEKWLACNLPELNVRVAMTIGGGLDYAAGVVPTPPRAFEKAGFEWLWRLFTQKGRAWRIFNAVVVFPAKVYLYKLRS